MTGKAFMVCFYFLFRLFWGGRLDENSTKSHFSIRRTRVMSVVKEGGNKPVYTDFFIKILFIRIPRRKNAED